MKKKKNFNFGTGSETDTANNQKAVSAVLNQSKDAWPTRTQLQEPIPGQQSLFSEESTVPAAAHTPRPAIIRRKSAEKRTKHKQLNITPTARRKLQERAEKEDISANECVNQLTAAAIRSGLQIKREKAPEIKSCRLLFVTTPTLEKAIREAADNQDVSFNEYVCFVLDNSDKVTI